MINGSYWVGAALGALGTLILLDPQRLPVWLGSRCAFGIGAILGLMVIFFRQWIPESPRWLMIHGRNHEAEQIIADVERLVEGASSGERSKMLPTPNPDANAHSMARDLGCDRSRTSAAFSARFCSHANSGILLQRDLFYIRAGADEILQCAGAECWRLPAAVRDWQCARTDRARTPLRYRGAQENDCHHLCAGGLLLALTGWLFYAGLLTAQTQTLAWSIIFFIASAAASSAYLTVSEIFPLEIRALAIAIFYAIGTLAGGVGAPILFGWLIGTGSSAALFAGYLAGAGLMMVGALMEVLIGSASRAKIARGYRGAPIQSTLMATYSRQGTLSSTL